MVDSIPSAETVIYNQMIFMPNQKRELSLLDKKKNRHASMPNPSNLIAVEDIKKVQDVIARENKQLVYAHYNLIVSVPIDEDIQKCTNHLENSFGRMGIHISKRAYNQLELFVNSFPGNCYCMNPDYDRFLTLSDAAACLMYKEHIQHNEDTPLKVYYTDRQGVLLLSTSAVRKARIRLLTTVTSLFSVLLVVVSRSLPTVWFVSYGSRTPMSFLSIQVTPMRDSVTMSTESISAILRSILSP
jgi:hypothetical protein